MGKYETFAVTKIGGSHTKQGKKCQDSSYATYMPEPKITAAAVADGHGNDNCFRSDAGSRFASFFCLKGMSDFITNYNAKFEQENEEWDKEVARKFIKHIIANWQLKVEENYTQFPFNDEEKAKVKKEYKAYGTTLIAAAITEHYWLGIHIGDGRFTVLNEDGSFAQPVPWDEKCVGNITTSICDDDAFERARVKLFPITPEKPPPVAVFLCSDGIDDNYSDFENEVGLNLDEFYRVYRTIAQCFAKEGFESAKKKLEDFVEKFASKGKADDASIAGFIDMERLKKVVSIWENE